MIVGYARVSSADQSLDVQLTAMRDAGAEKVFSEQKSGRDTKERPALRDCLDFIREGDVLVVTRLDRLGRSMKDLLDILEKVHAKGVAFRCLQQALDTTTPEGRLMFNLLGAFAEFEVDLKAERQREGIERAKALGKYKHKRGPRVDVAEIERLARGGWGASAIAKKLKVGRRTVDRHYPAELKCEQPEQLKGHRDAKKAARHAELRP